MMFVISLSRIAKAKRTIPIWKVLFLGIAISVLGPLVEAMAAENPNSDNNISIDQAISDEAQMKTIAFGGLAFLTGDLCSDTFFPPGKVSDFFGFQYMRDIMPNGFGHNTEFAGRVSDSVLSILADTQVQALVNLANSQAEQVDAYGYKRFVLMKAFRRLLENDLPDGTSGLDESAVKEFTADLYAIDSEISFARANVIGGIVAALTESQKTQLANLLVAFNTLFETAGEGGTISDEDWPPSSPVDLSGLKVADGRVLVSTYATQLFSWYLGSVEGDTYFCPERHGTYFGSFYMKDIPPITSTDPVTIDEGVTAEMGQAFLDVLDDTQKALVTGVVDIQRTDLYSIVSKRQEIAEKLRLFMNGSSVDKTEVLALVRQYGEYEGAMMYHYATRFAAVGATLTQDQTDTVIGIRLAYYERFPDYQASPNAYDCSGAWLYASKIEMPEIMNTDFLFVSESTEAYVHPRDNTCGGNSPCYATIQDAIDGVVDESSVKIAAGTYTETLTLSSPKTVTLDGGWDDGFSLQKSGATVIKAPKITEGTLRLLNLVIRP